MHVLCLLVPQQLAANIKELMSSTLETAKDGIACPIKQTSNVVLDKVSTGYQQSKNAIRDGIQFVLNSKLVYLAEQRANRALSLTENLVEYVLPVSSAETGIQIRLYAYYCPFIPTQYLCKR